MTQDTFVYDPSTAEFQQRMHDVYREMRDRHPLYVGRGFYAISRFSDLWDAIHDPDTFSSDGVAEAAQLMPQMIYMDPPRHTELRALVSRAFTPRRVAELEDRVRAVTRERIAGFASAGRCDVVHDLAAPVPSTIMSALIGGSRPSTRSSSGRGRRRSSRSPAPTTSRLGRAGSTACSVSCWPSVAGRRLTT